MARITGLYKITNPKGAVYIGQSVHCNVRICRYKNFECQRQPKIYASLKKYGVEQHTFEIICRLPNDVTKDVLNAYEELYISQYKACGISLMNLTGGGSSNKDLSPETREKLRQNATGKQYWLGRTHTQEAKDKIKAANTGVVFTKERLEKMSDSAKGHPAWNKGKPFSEETKNKMRLSRIGKKIPPDQIERMKASLRITLAKKKTA